MKDVINVGDTIACADKDDMVDTMMELAKCGVETDFDYSDGLKLVVTKVEEETMKAPNRLISTETLMDNICKAYHADGLRLGEIERIINETESVMLLDVEKEESNDVE